MLFADADAVFSYIIKFHIGLDVEADMINVMTRDAFLRQVESLSDEQFARVSPFLEADLQAVDALAALRDEIAEGRRSAANEPLLPADDVYDRVKRKLSS